MKSEQQGRSLTYSIRFGIAHGALLLACCALRFSVWCLAVPEIGEETPPAP